MAHPRDADSEHPCPEFWGVLLPLVRTDLSPTTYADLASATSADRRRSGWRVVHFLSLSTVCVPMRFCALITSGPCRLPVSQSPTLLQITKTCAKPMSAKPISASISSFRLNE